MSDGQMGGSRGILNRVVKEGLTEKGTKEGERGWEVENRYLRKEGTRQKEQNMFEALRREHDP